MTAQAGTYYLRQVNVSRQSVVVWDVPVRLEQAIMSSDSTNKREDSSGVIIDVATADYESASTFSFDT